MSYLKRTLIIVAATLLSFSSYAQSNSSQIYEQFAHKFVTIINHPVELIRNCKPTVCLLKINVDSAKNVLNMRLSDSADTLFIAEFKLHQHSLPTGLLTKYLKAEYPDNNCTTYLVPVSYSLIYMPCPPQSISIEALLNYAKFDGKYLSGVNILLNPISSASSVKK